MPNHQWEYKSLVFVGTDTVRGLAELDNLGRSGWELCAGVPWQSGAATRLIFKRPLDIPAKEGADKPGLIQRAIKAVTPPAGE